MKSKVLVADDHTLFRESLVSTLEKCNEFDLVKVCCSNGKEATIVADSHKPDIILMDLSMPVMDGLEATRIIKEKHPEIQIIILSMSTDEEFIIRSVLAGASGYLLKTIQLEKLIEHICSVLKGEGALDPKITQTLLNAVRDQGQTNINLAEREKEVLRLASEGKSNKEIANEMYISAHTVKSHFNNIFEKLGASDRTHAVALAFKKHII